MGKKSEKNIYIICIWRYTIYIYGEKTAIGEIWILDYYVILIIE